MTPTITHYTHGKPASPLAQEPVVDPDRLFFVTVRNDSRNGFLAGPFETHQEALDLVPQARQLAHARDPWAAFYSFGTASLPRNYPSMPTGIFNTELEVHTYA
ncbi:MAG: hypothetical protein H6661_03135 [Ardenticatenaceae bacterium]|nr:hypothetical protein [Ardenticatenaceae bacterium]